MTDSEIAVPHVLHIGFSKCGSSYLRALFRNHTAIDLVWKSGFFTPELYTPNPSRPTTLAEYRAMFDVREGILTVESDEHLTMPSVHPRLGVRGTNLDEFARLVKRIADLLPSVKILMAVRNQASLLLSRYSEYLIAGGTRGLDEFLSELMGYDGSGNRYFQNYYASMIDVLQRHFPSERLLVLAQEEMASDMAEVAGKVALFLGLEAPFIAARGFLSERKSLSVAGMKLLRTSNRLLVRRASFAGAPPDTRVPWFIYHNVVRAVRLVDHLVLGRFTRTTPCLLDETQKRSILAHFEVDNRRLVQHIDADLVARHYLVS